MTIFTIWLVGACVAFTWNTASWVVLFMRGQMRVHGIETAGDRWLLAYQEFVEVFKAAIAWPVSVPLVLLKVLRIIRTKSVGQITELANKSFDLGFVDVFPNDERSQKQMQDLEERILLELAASFVGNSFVKCWPLLSLAWECFDAGLTKHPLAQQWNLDLEGRQRYFLKIVSVWLPQAGAYLLERRQELTSETSDGEQ